jgi:hypothetical protein
VKSDAKRQPRPFLWLIVSLLSPLLVWTAIVGFDRTQAAAWEFWGTEHYYALWELSKKYYYLAVFGFGLGASSLFFGARMSPERKFLIGVSILLNTIGLIAINMFCPMGLLSDLLRRLFWRLFR